ncbi:MAG: hypothetical protein OHK0056_06300 [Bacteriovoracaceae bacterium]
MSWPYLSISHRCSLLLHHKEVLQSIEVESLDQAGIVLKSNDFKEGTLNFKIKFDELCTETLKGSMHVHKGYIKIRPNDRREYINEIWNIIKQFDHGRIVEILYSLSIPTGHEIWSVLAGLTDAPSSSWMGGDQWPEPCRDRHNIWNVGKAIQISSRKIVMVGQSPEMNNLRSQIPIGIKAKGMLNICGPVGSGRETLVKVLHEESGHDQQLHFARNFSELEETIKMAPLTPQLYYLKDIGHQDINSLSEISHLIAGQGSRLIIISEEPIQHPLLKNKIMIPSLKERKSDITLLIDHYLKYYATLFHFPTPVIMPDVHSKMTEYHYPGEIKELRSICNQIIGHAGHKGIISFDDVKEFIEFAKPEESNLKKVA